MQGNTANCSILCSFTLLDYFLMRKHLLPSACLPLSAAGSSVLVQSWQLNTAIELMHAVCFLFVCERARERERERRRKRWTVTEREIWQCLSRQAHSGLRDQADFISHYVQLRQTAQPPTALKPTHCSLVGASRKIPWSPAPASCCSTQPQITCVSVPG